MAKQKTTPIPHSGKGAWKARSDTGPHTATLPSGQQVRFIIPDSNALITSGRLPEELTEIALYAASYPDGAEGYVADLSVRASMGAENATEKLKQAYEHAVLLGHWLVAHMLIAPEITPEDVPELPPLDVRMLLELGERKRNTDAEGVRLPIAMLEEYHRFLSEPAGAPSDGDGAGVGAGVPEADQGPDEG